MKKIHMNNRLKLFICLIIIAITNICRAELITTYSINSSTIQKLEEWIDKDTIILIELDDVLVLPKSKMFSFDSNPYRMFIRNLVTAGQKVNAYNVAIANWYGQRQVRLVEDGWLDFIKRVRSKGAKIYGLCSMPIHLTNIAEKRLKELEDLGVIFDSKINDKEELVIRRETPWFSRFDRGIIYVGPYSKAQTIVELFKITNSIPKKLVTFANIKHDVGAIDKALRRFNMVFKSIQYLGAREVTGRPNSEVVKFQQRELIENGKWHEDIEAKKILDFRRQGAGKRAEF
jgi:hypothetical protein